MILDQTTFIFILFFFGLIVGSFLNVVILRLPAGERLSGRSHCPHCKATLTALDLVPVVSFLFLRGRCRHCRAPISPRYPALELITGLLFALMAFLSGAFVGTLPQLFELVLLCVVVSLAIVVFVIDLEHYLILDSIVLTVSLLLILILAGIDIAAPGWSTGTSRLLSGLWGALAATLFLGLIWLVSKGKWMGLGDVKFMVPFGLALGFPESLVGVFLAFFLGSFVAIPLLAFRVKTLKARLPFGTFLSVSMLLTFVFGSRILDWYLGIIGL